MPMTEWTTELAVRGGHVCSLDWLLSRDVALKQRNTDGACCWAADGGHLSMLQYLRNLEPPCPWDKWTCANAAKNGHLHVLQWVQSQPEPCPCD
jgi:hypothetical protein